MTYGQLAPIHLEKNEPRIQKLYVPGEALVQGREIGLRDGSHLARQLEHHRLE